MAKKPKPEPDDKQQSERFVETAQALAVDEGGKQFRQAMKTLVSQRKSAPKPKDG